jgi:hypothetical protein
MYPIDLLKVCPARKRRTLLCKANPNSTDPYASRQPYTRSDLHRYRQRDYHHFKSRGLHVIVEGCLECGTWRR